MASPGNWPYGNTAQPTASTTAASKWRLSTILQRLLGLVAREECTTGPSSPVLLSYRQRGADLAGHNLNQIETPVDRPKEVKRHLARSHHRIETPVDHPKEAESHLAKFPHSLLSTAGGEEQTRGSWGRNQAEKEIELFETEFLAPLRIKSPMSCRRSRSRPRRSASLPSCPHSSVTTSPRPPTSPLAASRTMVTVVKLPRSHTSHLSISSFSIHAKMRKLLAGFYRRPSSVRGCGAPVAIARPVRRSQTLPPRKSCGHSVTVNGHCCHCHSTNTIAI